MDWQNVQENQSVIHSVVGAVAGLECHTEQ
jgi:hypothetical protein